MKELTFKEKALAMVKLEYRSKKIKRKIKKVEKKNKKLFNDNLIIRNDHQRLYAQKKELCNELAVTLMAQGVIMGIEL